MSVSRYSVTAALVAVYCGTLHADAGNSWTGECRDLAGAPTEPGNGGAGVAFSRLDPKAAIPACRKALSENAAVENAFRLGRALEKAGEYEKAGTLYDGAARRGYAPAQARLGSLYVNGRGVGQDYAEAEKWSRRAAAQGDPGGKTNLGYLYATGNGVRRDMAEAVRLFREAAAAGSDRARMNLGVLYASGNGVRQDYGQAAYWFRLAAEDGNTDAQQKIGWLLSSGLGVTRDYGEAMAWFRKAAAGGNRVAQFSIGTLYEAARGVPRDYRAAAHWYGLAAENGYADAQYRLALLFDDGLGVERDVAKAIRWYREAARQGLPEADFQLAVKYARGEGVAADLERARALFEKAGRNGGERLRQKAREGIAAIDKARAEPSNSGAVLAALAALAAVAILAESGHDDSGSGAAAVSGNEAPACGREYDIAPASAPCGGRWRPPGQWPKRYWCYTDFNVRIGGNAGVTYCTDGTGTWEMSGLFDRCNGVEGWCD